MDGNYSTTIQAGYSGSEIGISIGQYLKHAVGDGTFGETQSLGFVAGGPFDGNVQVGDVNNDGFQDIITAPGGIFGVGVVILGNGNGSFKAPLTQAFNVLDGKFQLLDVNNDGNLDIVDVASGFPLMQVSLGHGDGTFSVLSFENSARMDSYTYGDINSDGTIDIITAKANNPANYQFNIYTGNGDGTFTGDGLITSGPETGSSLAAGDINGDGKLDIASTGSGKLEIFLGDGTGHFSQTIYANPVFDDPSWKASLVDLNNDGRLDIVTTTYNVIPTSNSMFVALQNGDGTFGAPVAYGGPGSASVTGSFITSDIDDDGFTDILYNYTSGSSFEFYRNNGDGTFTLAASTASATAHRAMDFADLNGDGIKDLVFLNGSSEVSFALGNGSYTTTISPMSVSFASQGAAAASLDNLKILADKIASERANVGAGLSRLTAAHGALSVMPENLEAARSRVADVDVAFESAALVRGTILQQVAASVLAQANQEPALALKLLS